MRARVFALVVVLTPISGLVVQGDNGRAPVHRLNPEDNKYAALAAYYQGEGMDFDRMFTVLCKLALSNTDNDDRLTLEDHVRSLFGGLWIWSQNRGHPILQSRLDWAFHFIGGGAFEGYFDVGHSAALVKERIDARDPDNRFDLDDMAATILGARWMNLATDHDVARARRWLELWASGQYTLGRSLPKLQYGQMPQGKEASAEAVANIRRAMHAALTLPAPLGAGTDPKATAPAPPPPSKN